MPVCIIGLDRPHPPLNQPIGPTELKQVISGWIIATDIDEAKRQAYSAGRADVAQALDRLLPTSLFPLREGFIPLADDIVMLVT